MTTEVSAVEEYMAKELVTVHPDTEAYEAIVLLLKYQISGSPVSPARCQAREIRGKLPTLERETTRYPQNCVMPMFQSSSAAISRTPVIKSICS